LFPFLWQGGAKVLVHSLCREELKLSLFPPLLQGRVGRVVIPVIASFYLNFSDAGQNNLTVRSYVKILHNHNEYYKVYNLVMPMNINKLRIFMKSCHRSITRAA